MKKLIKNYYQLCNEITKKFCEKQGFYFEDGFWVADKIGGVFCIADMCFDFSDILFDMKEGIPAGKIIEFYDWQLEAEYFGISFEKWISRKNKL